ncbi:MAG: hypothetical protein Q7T81_14510 [Pseudolabrys sp.]|nr:hypothetical protein [Pseudolabrys sp.]
MVAKKIYFNGVYLCNYESNGDFDDDRRAVEKILKDRGLHKEVSPEQSIFRQAVSFGTTAAYLWERDLSNVPRSAVSIAPFVVNATFALELYLKAVGLLHGVKLHGHDLVDLFDAIPEEAKQSLLAAFKFAKWSCAIKNLHQYREALLKIRKAFMEWRYLHEGNANSTIDFPSLIFMMEVAHEVCNRHPLIGGS